MNLIELQETLLRRQEMWTRLIGDVDGARSRVTLREGGPSMAWLVGHCTANADSVAEAVCGVDRTLPGDFADRHEQAHFGAHDDGAWEVLRQDWEGVARHLRSALEALTDGDLDQEPAVAIHPDFRQDLTTRRQFLSGHLFHLTWHAGQAGALRAALGLDWA